MTLVLINALVVPVLMLVLHLAFQEWVAHKNAAMVDQSALAYTGARSRQDLVNRRAHVNRDPRFAQNPANTGFIFFYDCRDADLLIEGEMPPCEFFGVSVYDRYSMPLPSMVIDGDLREFEGRYVVLLTTRPSGALNEIDVSAMPQGTGIIRCSHMAQPETITRYEPSLERLDRGHPLGSMA
jgi:hypothetical protein